MPAVLPATGICTGGVTDNVTEYAKLVTATAEASAASVAMAAAAAAVATKLTLITTKIVLSNRGAAVGVKGVTAATSVAVNQAVLTRRNTLAGATDQFPVPPVPPGI